MNINHDEKTPKALTILKYIEANPVCKSAQISHATGIESPRSYIKAHISRGAVIVAGESRKDMKMQLAQGQTAEGIYGNGYNKAKPAAITETALPAFNLSAADDAQMPVFIIKRQAEKPDEAAASPKFDTDLGFYTDTEPKKQEPFFIGFAKSACTRKLKIAYTNQKTIILFGLSDNPIELNPEDTQELVNYCADLDHFVIQKRA